MEQKQNIDNQALLAIINRHYGVGGEHMRLYRESGGRVYFVYGPQGKQVFKLYRPVQTEAAVQSTQVLSYLENHGFPVVQIIPTLEGGSYIAIDTPEGVRIGVLFAFAQGKSIEFLHRWRDNRQPLIHPKAKMVGQSMGMMHRLMEGYKGPLIPKGKERYIDDFVMLLHRDQMDKGKTRDIEEYGNQLWAAVEELPGGFCHGDMHTGNTVYYNRQFTWMDFDRVSYSYPVIDVGWLVDATSFNDFDDGALDRSMALFDAVYAGYSMERTLTAQEISAVFDCIAIVHYDLIGSIVLLQQDHLRKEFIDEQHDWLMRWRELCSKTL